jgi:hypothetical protein
LFLASSVAADSPARPARQDPFAIQIVDEQTGRGVPLVELKTVSNVQFFTDSAGYAAIDDPAMLGHRVYFWISSHGYEYPADGFGFRGKAIELTPGGSITLKMKRRNIAERLYRVTGEGIYRDSVILGKKPPIDQPLINAEVTGQDSVQNAIYQGKIWWFWGDTARQRYPLGHFGMSGATTLAPGAGGLSPREGVNLNYFTDAEGFARPMFDKEGAHPIWMSGLFVLKDDAGKEHMIGTASVIESLGKVLAYRMVEFDDGQGKFRTIKELPLDTPIRREGPTFIAEDAGKRYIYFGHPLPDLRVPADLKSAQDPEQYEAFTCLADGQQKIDDSTKIARDEKGSAIWAWRRNTRPLDGDAIKKLIRLEKLKPDERWFHPRDVSTRKEITLHAGSVNWNPFCKRWVMIANQIGGGTSMLGEVWYLEADAPQGPWDQAVKVVTHNKYGFYNPVHHAFFDEDGGRYIYFEGTYASTFEGKVEITPRYDYNQMMYRLDLADERLAFLHK